MKIAYVLVGGLLLCAAPACAETWGAIAVDNAGQFATAHGQPSKDDALNSVKKACGKRKCSFSWFEGTNWGTALHCSADGKIWGITKWGEDAKHAISSSYVEAISGGFTRRDCKLKALISAHGAHLRFKQ